MSLILLKQFIHLQRSSLYDLDQIKNNLRKKNPVDLGKLFLSTLEGSIYIPSFEMLIINYSYIPYLHLKVYFQSINTDLGKLELLD